MEIKFISTGGAFDHKIGNSAAVVRHPAGNILVDCGYTIYGSLRELDLIERIDYILITHLHGDHVGGLFPLIMHLNYRVEAKRKIRIIYPTENYREHLYQYFTFSMVAPERFIEFVPISTIEGLGFIDTFSLHSEHFQTFAYYFENDDSLIYYSGDIGTLKPALDFLQRARQKNIRVFHEISFIEVPTHTYYKDLIQSLGHYEVYGYHCNHHDAPKDNSIRLVAECPELCFGRF